MRLPGPTGAGTALCEGGSEVNHGGGQGEQVACEGGEGGQELHGSGPIAGKVVRGGRSVLTFLSVRPLRQRSCALLCGVQRASEGWLVGRRSVRSRAHSSAQSLHAASLVIREGTAGRG